MITGLIQKLAGAMIRMPGVRPRLSEIALGRVAEVLARKCGQDGTAADFARLREARLAASDAERAKHEQAIAKATAAVERDNIRKRDQAHKEAEAISKNLASTTDPAARSALIAEQRALHMERILAAQDRAEAAISRLRAKGRVVLFDPNELEQLADEGRIVERLLTTELSTGDETRAAAKPPATTS